jgi:hypothetical protein
VTDVDLVIQTGLLLAPEPSRGSVELITSHLLEPREGSCSCGVQKPLAQAVCPPLPADPHVRRQLRLKYGALLIVHAMQALMTWPTQSILPYHIDPSFSLAESSQCSDGHAPHAYCPESIHNSAPFNPVVFHDTSFQPLLPGSEWLDPGTSFSGWPHAYNPAELYAFSQFIMGHPVEHSIIELEPALAAVVSQFICLGPKLRSLYLHAVFCI